MTSLTGYTNNGLNQSLNGVVSLSDGSGTTISEGNITTTNLTLTNNLITNYNTISNLTLSYLYGLTGNIQTQINSFNASILLGLSNTWTGATNTFNNNVVINGLTNFNSNTFINTSSGTTAIPLVINNSNPSGTGSSSTSLQLIQANFGCQLSGILTQGVGASFNLSVGENNTPTWNTVMSGSQNTLTIASTTTQVNNLSVNNNGIIFNSSPSGYTTSNIYQSYYNLNLLNSGGTTNSNANINFGFDSSAWKFIINTSFAVFKTLTVFDNGLSVTSGQTSTLRSTSTEGLTNTGNITNSGYLINSGNITANNLTTTSTSSNTFGGGLILNGNFTQNSGIMSSAGSLLLNNTVANYLFINPNFYGSTATNGYCTYAIGTTTGTHYFDDNMEIGYNLSVSGSTTFTNLPTCTQTPTTSYQLINKTFGDSRYSILSNNNTYSGTNTFNSFVYLNSSISGTTTSLVMDNSTPTTTGTSYNYITLTQGNYGVRLGGYLTQGVGGGFTLDTGNTGSWINMINVSQTTVTLQALKVAGSSIMNGYSTFNNIATFNNTVNLNANSYANADFSVPTGNTTLGTAGVTSNTTTIYNKCVYQNQDLGYTSANANTTLYFPLPKYCFLDGVGNYTITLPNNNSTTYNGVEITFRKVASITNTITISSSTANIYSSGSISGTSSITLASSNTSLKLAIFSFGWYQV